MNFVFINLSQKREREDADGEEDGAGGNTSNSSKKVAASGEGNRPIAAPAIQYKAPLGVRPDGCDTVFVGNLSWDVDEQQMIEFFSSAGEVDRVKFATAEDGLFKGFGHVQFIDGNATDAAVKLTGSELNGRSIRVDYAPPRTRDTPSFGGRGGGAGGAGSGGQGFGGGGRGGTGGGRGTGAKISTFGSTAADRIKTKFEE